MLTTVFFIVVTVSQFYCWCSLLKLSLDSDFQGVNINFV